MNKTKADVLTEEEFASFNPAPRTFSGIEEYVKRAKRPQGETPILDWGCGKGRAVLWLRERGYQAFGVDIDPKPIESGRPLFRQKGHDDLCLHRMDENGRTQYPDAYFYYIFSNQVLEHVSELENMAGELYRIMAPGGEGLHIYPAHRRIVEVHLFMPLVHWLPKNALRKRLIGFFVRIGKEPRWIGLEGKTRNQKTETYFHYSTERTFYRSPGKVRNAFENAGFDVKLVTIDNPLLAKFKLLAFLGRCPLTRPVIQYLLHTFRTVELLIRKPSPSSERLQPTPPPRPPISR